MALTHLLDTDTCSFAVMGEPAVFARLEQLDRTAWAISSLVAAELHFGLARGQLFERSRVALEKFLVLAPVISFDDRAAREAARVRHELAAVGKPAGAVDTLIAGHARSLGLTLVTGNTRHFDEVSGLALEDWTERG